MKGMANLGAIYIGPDKQIREKFFREAVRRAVHGENVLSRLFPEKAESDLHSWTAAHLQLQSRQSEMVAGPGSRVTLILEAITSPNIYAYVPDTQDYQQNYTRDRADRASAGLRWQVRISQDIVVSFTGGFRHSLSAKKNGVGLPITLLPGHRRSICYLPEQGCSTRKNLE
jgi:hypothetical protein